jgi:hypothetical protein
MTTHTTRRTTGAALLALMIGPAAAGCGDYESLVLPALAARAVSEDGAEAGRAVAALRAIGPRGLDALVAVHEADLAAYRASLHDPESCRPPSAPSDEDAARWSRLRTAVDTVGGQRDNFVHPLYWHTDLEQAKAWAQATRRPILSLRLLGRLDEEYSCANSRFFRTALYANEAVARLLRERFVLHWESVRPVPRITIDFGDGRTLERTITGNSAHHVLDTEGRPIDVIPGLYGPGAFHRALVRVADAAARLLPANADRAALLAAYHQVELDHTATRWARDLAAVTPVSPPPPLPARPPLDAAPNAFAAMPIAKSKSVVESPMLRMMMLDPDALADATDDGAWARMAARHAPDARLDDGSILVMRKKMAAAGADGGGALEPMIERFEALLALDTVHNEYELRRAIHGWFVDGTAGDDVAALNDRVYAELFLTPGSDPWLGLVPADAYAALDGRGLVCR